MSVWDIKPMERILLDILGSYEIINTGIIKICKQE
jgi:hypothetical protein